MRTLDRIVPILARTVMTVGILTGFGSVVVAVVVGAPQLLLFTAVALAAAAYGRKVAHREAAVEAATSSATVHPLAA